MNYSDKDIKKFCVIYRPDTFKLNWFPKQFDDLLIFLRSLNYEYFRFGDFNNETLRDATDKNRHMKTYYMLITLPYKIQSQPGSCQHIKSFYFVSAIWYNNTQNTIIWPLYKIGEITIAVSRKQSIVLSKLIMRNRRNNENDNDLNSLFAKS